MSANSYFLVLVGGKSAGETLSVRVEAHSMNITNCGALVFSMASGKIVKAFPSGSWINVDGF